MKNKNKIRIEKLPIFGILLSFGVSKFHSGWHIDMVGYTKNTPNPQFVSSMHTPLKHILIRPKSVVRSINMLVNKVKDWERVKNRILNKELIEKATELHL